jgi:hypothetical protein
MHISHLDAQALAASTLQEAAEARARGRVGLTRRERLGGIRQQTTEGTQEPEVAIEGTDRREPEEEAERDRGDEPEYPGHSLNVRA